MKEVDRYREKERERENRPGTDIPHHPHAAAIKQEKKKDRDRWIESKADRRDSLDIDFAGVYSCGGGRRKAEEDFSIYIEPRLWRCAL